MKNWSSQTIRYWVLLSFIYSFRKARKLPLYEEYVILQGLSKSSQVSLSSALTNWEKCNFALQMCSSIFQMPDHSITKYNNVLNEKPALCSKLSPPSGWCVFKYISLRRRPKISLCLSYTSGLAFWSPMQIYKWPAGIPVSVKLLHCYNLYTSPL